MTPRDIILSLGSAVLLGTVGFLLFAPRSEVIAFDPPSGPASAPGAIDDGPAPDLGPVVLARNAPEAPAAGPRIDTTGWTSGRVEGDILLDPRVVHDLGAITVQVIEAPRAGDDKPYSEVQSIRWRKGQGTPSFRFDNVPFSPAGYAIAVHAEGLNGSQRFVSINEETPHRQVELSISPPVPFTVLLRDQFKNPVAETRVELHPTGQPLGRPVLHGSTDNFGSLTFAKTLAGHYQIYVGSLGLHLVDVVETDVQPAGFVFNRSAAVSHQFVEIEVPQGELVTVNVSAGGYSPVGGARLRVYRTDARQYREYVGETDPAGQCKMPPLPAGRYHVAVEHPQYQQFDEEFQLDEVGAQGAPRQFDVRLRMR